MDLGDERVNSEFERMRLHAALSRQHELVDHYFAGIRVLINHVDDFSRRLGRVERELGGGE